jgi:hypothetical protein
VNCGTCGKTVLVRVAVLQGKWTFDCGACFSAVDSKPVVQLGYDFGNTYGTPGTDEHRGP